MIPPRSSEGFWQTPWPHDWLHVEILFTLPLILNWVDFGAHEAIISAISLKTSARLWVTSLWKTRAWALKISPPYMHLTRSESLLKASQWVPLRCSARGSSSLHLH